MVHKSGVHACPECAKTFTRAEYVERHRRLKHLGIRPWSCPCGVSYARSDLLCRHKRKCALAMGQGTPPTSHQDQQSIVLPASIPDGPLPVHTSPLVEPFASLMFGDNDMHGGAQPPSYDQAIGYNPAPCMGDSDVWVQLPPSNPISNQPEFDYHASPSTHSSQYRFEEGARSNPVSASRLASNAVVNQSNSPACDQEISSFHPTQDEATGSNDIPQISHPSSQIIRYSDPRFFITEEPTSSAFYLNPNLWVIAFLCQRGQGFTIPTVGTLSGYLRKSTSDMLPLIPMIHVPTFKASNISIHLGYALTVAGAASDNSEQAIAFANQSLLYKRPLVQRDFALEANPFDFRFELLQTLLTYQFLGVFNRIDHQRQRAVLFNDTLIQDFRALDLTRIVQDAPDYVKLALDGHMPLELAWRSWAKYETHKRTAFLVLMSAHQLSDHPGLMIEDVNLILPCHEEVWFAPDAESWLLAMYRHTSICKPGEKPTIGEESIPRLTHALAKLSLGPEQQTEEVTTSQLGVEHYPGGNPALASPEIQRMLCPSPVVDHSGQFTTPHEIQQLGRFANLVLGHCKKLEAKSPRFVSNLLVH